MREDRIERLRRHPVFRQLVKDLDELTEEEKIHFYRDIVNVATDDSWTGEEPNAHKGRPEDD